MADVALDFGKWCIGRYTTVSPLASVFILIFSSFLIAVISKFVCETKAYSKFISYLHHGQMFWTRNDMKGKHWDYMVCPECKKFEIQGDTNKCSISAEVHELCKKRHLVLNVWECVNFKKK